MPRLRHVVFALASAACLSACGPSISTHRVDLAPRGSTTADQVQTLYRRPERAHRVIAYVKASGGGIFGDHYGSLRKQAAALGGDALILTGSGTEGSGVVNSAVVAGRRYEMERAQAFTTGMVSVWTEPDPAARRDAPVPQGALAAMQMPASPATLELPGLRRAARLDVFGGMPLQVSETTVRQRYGTPDHVDGTPEKGLTAIGYLRKPDYLDARVISSAFFFSHDSLTAGSYLIAYGSGDDCLREFDRLGERLDAVYPLFERQARAVTASPSARSGAAFCAAKARGRASARQEWRDPATGGRIVMALPPDADMPMIVVEYQTAAWRARLTDDK